MSASAAVVLSGWARSAAHNARVLSRRGTGTDREPFSGVGAAVSVATAAFLVFDMGVPSNKWVW
ncbi:hypothetical protein CJ469_06443 [Nocardia farcinica]|nr:hypothetical protein CJ469_06443 [Nocardia farcinica]